MPNEQGKSIDLDDLQNETEKLLSLLKDRQLGLTSWNNLLSERLKSIHQKISPVVENK